MGVPVPKGVRDLLASTAALTSAPRSERVHGAVVSLFDQALRRLPDGSIFVLTGDIPAMWLRDSTWQVRPLLAAAHDAETYEVLAAISRRQTEFICIDPYANAFNMEPNGQCWHRDFADQSPWVFERKYELDSLTSMLDLAVRLCDASNRTDHLDAQFFAAATVAMDVIEREQHHDAQTYRLRRSNVPEHDHLSHDGFGAPVAPTGMSWSGFRPSDDACTLGYHIASNAHAVSVLDRLANMPARVSISDALRHRAASLAATIRQGIRTHGVVVVDDVEMFAYEVDGLGNSVLMDDANVPSLLSLPYLGWCDADDPIYAATRRWVLSTANPWFASGVAASGVGSPHTPIHHVWPIAIAMAGLTADNETEVHRALTMLESTDATTGRMHESFHVNDPSIFTRPWFSWADMTYVHLVLRSIDRAFD